MEKEGESSKFSKTKKVKKKLPIPQDEVFKGEGCAFKESEAKKMIITKRDKAILSEVLRWHGMLARQIKLIGEFSGDSALYRRIKLLVDNGYLEKKRYVYGIPSIYTTTNKGRKETCLDMKLTKISLGQIKHDIAVVDAYLFFKEELRLSSEKFAPERELRQSNGFRYEGHKPDILITQNDKTMAIEIELTIKNEDKLEKNLKSNFMNFDKQLWVIEKQGSRLHKKLKEFKKAFPNTEIMLIEEITMD